MEAKGKIVCKKSDNKAFKLGEDWYNVDTNVIPILTKMNKGDEAVVTYEKKGVARYVSNMVLVGADNPAPAAAKEEKNQSTPVFKCEVCGKELKDGKFKKCYECNMAAKGNPAAKAEIKTDSTEFKCIDCGAPLKDNKYTKCYECNKKNPVKKSWSGKGGFSNKSNYGSPEDIAGKEIGCALNAAASASAGQQFTDPDAAAQWIKIVADQLLEWVRGKK
jgi:DNA-directed RNA polymerase subunit RPC12/RpoP